MKIAQFFWHILLKIKPPDFVRCIVSLVPNLPTIIDPRVEGPCEFEQLASSTLAYFVAAVREMGFEDSLIRRTVRQRHYE